MAQSQMLDIIFLSFFFFCIDTILSCNLYLFFFWYRYYPAFEWDIFSRPHGDFTARFLLMCVYSFSAVEIIGKWCLTALLTVHRIAGTTWLFIVMLKPLVRIGLLKKKSL